MCLLTVSGAATYRYCPVEGVKGLTLYGEPRVWPEQFPEGQATEIYRDHLGLRYPGEVIRAASWSASLGEPLEQDVYFRIVLMSRRWGNLRPRIRDSRIAVCLPGAGSSRRRTSSIRELAATRETQAFYLSSAGPDADLITTTLRRRQEGLEQDILGEESVRYSQGLLVTEANSPLDANEIFAGVDPQEWFYRLAGQLLEQAYPVLPLDALTLPRPITYEDVPVLYRRVFDHPGAGPYSLSALGPALGLSLRGDPEEFNASECRPLDLLREWLSQHPGQADLRAAHRYLAHEVGLTGPLAHLYLLLFVYLESPPVEINLASREGISTVDGRPLMTRRLTNDLIALLPWRPEMVEAGAQINRESEPQWADTLQHLACLSPNLAAVSDQDDSATGEAVLAHDIESLSQELAQSHNLLAQLYQATGEPEFPELAGPLERLAAILGEASAGPLAIYRRIRESYSQLEALEDDISVMHRVAETARFLPEILAFQAYLDGADVPESALPELSIERQGLLVALSLAGFVRSSGRTWESLNQEVAHFKSSYGAAYRSHHTEFHNSLPVYQRNLEAAKQNSRALELLNSIPGLAGAEGLGLAESLQKLNQGSVACHVEGEGLRLEDSPVCGSCGLTLANALPLDELNRISSAINAALAVQNQKLSHLLVDKIMQDADDPRLDDLIRIVQTSDLSVLSNTLNQELVDFIQRILA